MSKQVTVQTLPLNGSTSVMSEMPITKQDIVEIFEEQYVKSIKDELAVIDADIKVVEDSVKNHINKLKNLVAKLMLPRFNKYSKTITSILPFEVKVVLNPNVYVSYNRAYNNTIIASVKFGCSFLLTSHYISSGAINFDFTENEFGDIYAELKQYDGGFDYSRYSDEEIKLNTYRREVLLKLDRDNVKEVIKSFRVKMTKDALKGSENGRLLLAAMQTQNPVNLLK